MTTTAIIPTNHFAGRDIQPGDTLRVLSVTELAVTVEVLRRGAARGRSRSKVSAWLRTAKGSVRLLPGETVDDARMTHLRRKHALGA